MKKISVIIPIYNAGRYLGETLDSVAAETHKNIEIICVLDAPTDDSAAIVKKYAARDARIKIIRHRKNMGLPAARNSGAKAATGEYIHFMDADDLINPEFYETLAAAADDADADAAACSVIYEKKPRRGIAFRDGVASGAEKFAKTMVFEHGWAWRWLIRRDLWMKRGLAFPDLVPMEDKPAMIKMVHYANRIALCSGAAYFYKNREGSILGTKYDAARNKRRHDNRKKARRIIGDFVRANKIRRPCRLWRLITRPWAKIEKE